jgi:phosphoribosyl 1,2-cyclic phosphodiesterase
MSDISPTEYLPLEDLVDVPGAEHLALKYGDAFQSWYLFKTFKRHESVASGYQNSSCIFSVYDYSFRFVIPSRIEIGAGVISYSDADREFGVFRFPRDEQGNFVSPLTLPKGDVLSLSEEEIKGLLKRQRPIVFDAYKIPRFGFEYFSVSNEEFSAVAGITTVEHAESLKASYESQISIRVEEVKGKISMLPNTLLILRKVLNREMENLDEVATATNNIIHI